MGDIIEINSKSGLEGSNKNFAYAGGKFGGIGLVESFCAGARALQHQGQRDSPGELLRRPAVERPRAWPVRAIPPRGKSAGRDNHSGREEFLFEQVADQARLFAAEAAKAIFYAVEQTSETGQAIPVTGGQVMLR